MKIIKIFLASSILELKEERLELSSYVASLNNLYVSRGIYFRLILCEHLSDAVARERKQDEYNREIRDSDYFYVIFGARAGKFTQEEFDVAYRQFHATGAPKIYTYFKQLPDDEIESTVREFLHGLEQSIGHYPNYFTHVDTIKLNILTELTQSESVGGTLSLEDGMMKLDGNDVLSMENIPLYSRNDTVQRLLHEKSVLEAEFGELVRNIAIGEGTAANDRLLLENSGKRNRIAEQLHTLEKDVLGLCLLSSEKRKLGQHLNWREKKALELIDAGESEAAQTLLRDRAWKDEVRRAKELADSAIEPLREFISGQRTLVAAIKSEGINDECAAEITEIYEGLITACHSAWSNLSSQELMFLCDYAHFLWQQNSIKSAIGVAELLQYHFSNPEIKFSTDENAVLFNLLGILYAKQHDAEKAEPAFRSSLQAYRKLAKEDPSTFLRAASSVGNNFAAFLADQNQPQDADKLYREALATYRTLAVEDPSTLLPYISMTCNNLANLLAKQHQPGDAEQLYLEALEIRRKLAAENPAEYLPDVATTCHNFAYFLAGQHRPKESDDLYREALRIRRALAKENAAAFLPDVAATCSNLAILLSNRHPPQEAEGLYREALDIRRRLAEENAETFLPDVATTCNNFALFLHRNNQPSEAEALYREALDIRRKLFANNPDVFLPSVAETCNNLANLLKTRGQPRDAERLYREAMENYRKLSSENSSAFSPYLGSVCNNLALFLVEQKRPKEAAPLYDEALTIRRKLAAEDPEAFLPDVGMTLFNLAIFSYDILHDAPKSCAFFEEALEIYSQFPQYSDIAVKIREILAQHFVGGSGTVGNRRGLRLWRRKHS